MKTLTINRKPKGIYGKPQQPAAEPQQPEPQQPDKATVAHTQDSNQQAQKKPTAKRKSAKNRKNNTRRLARLVALWPVLFSLESPRPLKVGILDDLMHDIAARGISFGQGALRATLARYARTRRYYSALIAGGARYDLKDQPCGEVTPQQQEHAAKLLEAMKNRQQERRADKEKASHDTGQ